ncbi:MAG: PBP1A family penicillin-binding protein [Ignavibacteriae bacterium]|nr:PBP1A family penicillin-binding protein [Ignavibacteriota bacterium]
MAKRKRNKREELDRYLSDRDYRKKKVKKVTTERYSIRVVLFSIFIIFFVLLAYLLYLSQTLPSLSELENPELQEATKIYSDDGVLIDRFYLQNRTIVSIDSLPPYLIDALVAIEDRKFYDHWGVDVQRIFQAFVKNILSGDLTNEGASTITQQLAGNLYVGREVTLNRKIREAMTAIQMERTYTKKEILAYYFNTVYFGKGAHGIEAAARTYFDKSAKDLTLNESAILVGLLKSPTRYDPIENPENSLTRRNIVLNAMREEGYIDDAQYELVKNDPIKVNYKKQESVSESIAPQFSEYVRQILQRKAETYGYDLYRDGLKVYTTLDTRFQKAGEKAITEQLRGFQKSFNNYWSWGRNSEILKDAIERSIKYSEEYKACTTEEQRKTVSDAMRKRESFIDSVKTTTLTVQVAFVCIDPKTGEIKAMVGSNPDRRFKYGLNRVTQMKRQPGSSFKPFVYADAVNKGYSPGYMISNDPIRVNMGGTIWSPKGGGTGGMISMRLGLTKSINVIAVRTAMELAPIDEVIPLAHDMGIKSELPNFLSLSLGAGEVTPLEMTNAYATFANDGIWVEPIAIKRIEDRHGNLIEEFLPDTREVLSEGVAYIMSDMMEDVINEGTATSVRNYFHRPAAGKTGTSQNHTDAWFIGFTPQYVAGVWVGFDDARIKMGSFGQGGVAAAPIWGRFMKYLYDEMEFPIAYFLMPDDVEEANICTVTGLVSNGSCPSVTELVLKKYLPKKCNISHAPIDFEETASSPNGDSPPPNE